jgi:hypothetical protein
MYEKQRCIFENDIRGIDRSDFILDGGSDVDSRIAYVYETQGNLAAFLYYTSDPLLSTHEGNLKLKIRTLENDPENLEVLRELGIDILTVSADGTTIVCYATISSLQDLGKLEFIKDVSSEKEE